MKNCELLSPAGSYEALVAAVNAGADAVYLGGSCFNARQSAQNFTDEQLIEAINYCHLRFVKVYVAVNILISDKEFNKLTDYINFINNIGADGVIVQDLGVAKLIHEITPDLPLHASTQMTAYDLDGALLLQSLGFTRVVLARELSRGQIKEICEKTDLEVEVFVHGAICVSYSGQCLMSSMIGGRSGNRGRCAQPCRLSYTIENKAGFLLSPKDMCLINYINDLKSIGVNSFKIEGRMKGPDYVGTVVSIYRKYIDSGEKVTKEDYTKLESIFYRGGFTSGYYTGKKGKDMFCHTKPDNPYLKQTNTEYEEYKRQRLIDIKCNILLDKPIQLSVSDEFGNHAEYEGNIPSEAAVNRPLSEDRTLQQLSKLGGTVFKLNKCAIYIDDGVTIPISEINTARRNAINQLEKNIIKSFRRENVSKIKNVNLIEISEKSDFSFAAQVSNNKQLEALIGVGCKTIYTHEISESSIPAIPRIVSEDFWNGFKFNTALASNIGHIYKLKTLGVDIYTDYSINIFNQYAISVLEQLNVKRITVSTELMLSQIRDFSSKVPLEAIIYGRLPLMITENCIIKSTVGCMNKKGGVLTDRTGEKFTVRCVEGCRNEILNSKPIVMSDKLNDIKNSGISVGRLFFTTESPSECIEIYNSYLNNKKIDCDFTRGKFYKGVD